MNRFNLPDGVDIDKMSSEYKLSGKLVITAPQIALPKGANEPEVVTESTASSETKTLDDDTVVKMTSSSTRKSSSTTGGGEMTIPIAFGAAPSLPKPRTPRPRMLPFSFNLPDLPGITRSRVTAFIFSLVYAASFQKCPAFKCRKWACLKWR